MSELDRKAMARDVQRNCPWCGSDIWKSRTNESRTTWTCGSWRDEYGTPHQDDPCAYGEKCNRIAYLEGECAKLRSQLERLRMENERLRAELAKAKGE